jgi:cyclin A
MEHLVLKVLAFDLAAPTVNQFLTQYFLHQQPANCKVESLAMVSSFCWRFLGYN